MIQDAVFDHLRERIASSDSAAIDRVVDDFEAEWMTVVTWNHSIPYHWLYNMNEVCIQFFLMLYIRLENDLSFQTRLSILAKIYLSKKTQLYIWCILASLATCTCI